jgi:signal transduction histidine kinase
MAWLIDEVLALLSTEAGTLAYHLVLVFSIAGAFLIAISHPSNSRSISLRRTITGLGLLLLLQVFLFIAAGLAWQGMVNEQLWLPIADRIVALLSLILIAWLWAFPKPEPATDIAALSVGFLAVIGSIGGAIWWQRLDLQSGIIGFTLNGSQIDNWMQITSLIFISLGLFILLLVQPRMAGYGVEMLLLFACGYLLQIMTVHSGGDYPSIVRLFEMTAYPFLLLLPQRSFGEGAYFPFYDSESPGQKSLDNRPAHIPSVPAIDLQILQSLLLINDDQDEEQVYRRIVTILSAAAGADRAFLVSPPDPDDKLNVLCDFDRISDRFLESTPLDASELPILTSCLKQGRVRRLAAGSTAPDRLALSRIYGLEQAGEMLFVPFLSADGEPLSGSVLIASKPQVEWDADKQSTIGLLARLLVDFAERSHQNQTLQSELDQTRQSIRKIQVQAQQTLDERQRLLDRIAVLQENLSRDQQQIALLSTVTLDRDALEKKIADLEVENRRLGEITGEARKEATGRSHPLEEELRLTLSEIAILRMNMEEMEMQLAELRARQNSGAAGESQLANILTIAQDLRQPLASITDNTDMFQIDTANILTREQQKYLERIRLAAGRINRLIDELAQAARTEANSERLNFERIDICNVIREATSDEEDLIRLRRLWLQTSLPEQPLLATSDHVALRAVFGGLLHNAATATSEGGQLGISARLESSKTERDYVLIQISDQGGGISIQDMPRVFVSPPSSERINGLGDGSVDIGRLKVLVEALQGHIWVDCESEVGSTFSLLLPIDIVPADLEAD